MVDGAALEKRWAMSLVGSNPTLSAVLHKSWRGAGVADQARLESACRLWRPWVRIPPSPPEFKFLRYIKYPDVSRIGAFELFSQCRTDISQPKMLCLNCFDYWEGERFYRCFA